MTEVEATIKSKNFNTNKMCCVPKCHNRCCEEISMHTFPKAPTLREQWMKVLKIGKCLSPFAVVCSAHFKCEDFFLHSYYAKKRRLKKGIVPSQNIPEEKVLPKRSNCKLAKTINSSDNQENQASSDLKLQQVVNASNFVSELQDIHQKKQLVIKRAFPSSAFLKSNLLKRANSKLTGALKRNRLRKRSLKNSLRFQDGQIVPQVKQGVSSINPEETQTKHQNCAVKEDSESSDDHSKRRHSNEGAVPPAYSVGCSYEKSVFIKRAKSEVIREKSETKDQDVQTSPLVQMDAEVNTMYKILLTDHDYTYKRRPTEKEIKQISTSKKVFADASAQADEMKWKLEHLTIIDLISTPKQLNAFTGLSSFDVLNDIVKAVENIENNPIGRTKIPLRQCVMLTLIKLKLNLPFICLAAFFKTCENTCKTYFIRTLELLKIVLEITINFHDRGKILKTIYENLKKYYIPKPDTGANVIVLEEE